MVVIPLSLGLFLLSGPDMPELERIDWQETFLVFQGNLKLWKGLFFEHLPQVCSQPFLSWSGSKISLSLGHLTCQPTNQLSEFEYPAPSLFRVHLPLGS